MAPTARPPRCVPRRWRTQAASHWHCAPPCSSSRPTQCYLTDQIEEAIAARLSALGILQELDDWRQEGHVLRWLSRLHWFLGRNDKADRYANAAVAMLDGLPPGCEMAWALSNRAQLHILASDADEAVAWGTRAIELATRLGDSEALVHALNNVGTAEDAQGAAEGHAKV